MTNNEAIEHAKALKQFCRDADCRQCPFGKESDFKKKVNCKLVDDEEAPCWWDLEEEDEVHV